MYLYGTDDGKPTEEMKENLLNNALSDLEEFKDHIEIDEGSAEPKNDDDVEIYNAVCQATSFIEEAIDKLQARKK